MRSRRARASQARAPPAPQQSAMVNAYALVLALAVLMLQTPAAALRLAVISKIIVDQVEGSVPRLGGGGVQAAVAAQIAMRGQSECRLVAPVGMDFVDSMLHGLAQRRVDTSGVCRLSHVARTPGEAITYEGETAKWTPSGWDHWNELCAWVPQLASAADLDAVHVIVEGGGNGEVLSVLAALSELPAGERRPTISVEPVMHVVDDSSVAGLARITSIADVVSPDLLTAYRLARPDDRQAEQHAARKVVEDGGEEALAVLARGCASTIALRPTAVLAIRDGARGSYLLCNGELRHVPALKLDKVLDPTGAGNGYAGALAAQIASGATPMDAAAVASAVGAAFCRTGDWAPTLEEGIAFCFGPYALHS